MDLNRWLNRFKFAGFSDPRKKGSVHASVNQAFCEGESGVTTYGLISATLMLIGVGAWVVATAPRVVASAQMGINPLEMMADARDLPTAQYDDSISSSGYVASLVEPLKMHKRRVDKSHR